MIPKIIEGRRDKKSSFGQLIKYMADKPSQELTDTVQPTPETALAVKSDMFEGLNNYLTRKQKVISTPVDVERVYSVLWLVMLPASTIPSRSMVQHRK